MTAQPRRGGRPLRADAARNEQRLIDGARQAIAEHGLSVGAERIAAFAGVGVGTLYRRYPNKQDLIELAVLAELEPLREAADRAAHDADPWAGLVALLTAFAAAASDDLGALQAIESDPISPAVAITRDRILGALAVCVQQAHAAGELRHDITLEDLGHLLHGVVGIKGGPGGNETRRHWQPRLTVLLAGLRTERQAEQRLHPKL